MEIGIGLPNPVPELDGRRIPAWAAQAEARGFSSLATIDRLSFPNHDSMITLAAAAGATERIRLFTNILLLPTRQPVLLAKEAASLASVSGGRFVLGVGVGGREDDYVVSETSFASRGRRADRMLEQMTQAWRGGPIEGSSEPVVPAIPGGTVPLMIGGSGPAAVRRTVTYGIGWTGGGAPPEHTAPVVQKVRAAWAAAGRQGEPRIAALAYFSLGDHVRERSHSYLRRYYAQFGQFAESIATGALRSPEAIRRTVAAFADAGVDELILDPTVAELDQIDRLADVVL